MARVVGGLGSPFGYSREYTADYQRFKKQYAQLTIKDISRASQLRHFSDAYYRVRSQYVHVTNDKLLIDSAIKGLREIKERSGTISSERAIEAALGAHPPGTKVE